MKKRMLLSVVASALLVMLLLGCPNESTDNGGGGSTATTEQVTALNNMMKNYATLTDAEAKKSATTLGLTYKDGKMKEYAAEFSKLYLAETTNVSLATAYAAFGLGTGNAAQYALIFPIFKEAVANVNDKA